MAGGLSVEVSLRDVPCTDDAAHDGVVLFSESSSRFVLEVRPEDLEAVAWIFNHLPLGRLGTVAAPERGVSARLVAVGLDGMVAIDATVDQLKRRWKRSLLDMKN